MTEDDTFRKLKQLPYEQLRDLLSSMIISGRPSLIKLLNENNWTNDEFNIRDRLEYRRSWPATTSVYTYFDIYHNEIKKAL